MSLRDYEKPRDKFEPETKPSFGYGFPCNACRFQAVDQRMEPCRTCDHNANSVPDTKEELK